MAWVEKQNGKYKGRYKDHRGRNHSMPLQTSRKKALQLASDEEAKIRNGGWVDPAAGKMTFAEYFHTRWLPRRIIEANTAAHYRHHFEHDLNPVFGDLQLRKITRVMVQDWVADMRERGYSGGSARAKYKAMATIMGAKAGASAVNDELIGITPCRLIQLPKDGTREVEIFEPYEMKALLKTTANGSYDWWQPLIELAYESGMRWGELIALRPMDINLRGVISVHRTIIEVRKDATGNGTRFAIKDYPKSGEARKVGVSRTMHKILTTLAAERGLRSTDLFFTMAAGPAGWHPPLVYDLTRRTSEVWAEGLPVSRTHFRDVWLRLLAQAGLPHRRFHDLRATHISLMLRGNGDYPAVMLRVGHKDSATTQRYSQAGEGADQRAQDAFARGRGADKKKKGKKNKKGQGLRAAS